MIIHTDAVSLGVKPRSNYSVNIFEGVSWNTTKPYWYLHSLWLKSKSCHVRDIKQDFHIKKSSNQRVGCVRTFYNIRTHLIRKNSGLQGFCPCNINNTYFVKNFRRLLHYTTQPYYVYFGEGLVIHDKRNTPIIILFKLIITTFLPCGAIIYPYLK